MKVKKSDNLTTVDSVVFKANHGKVEFCTVGQL
jgi:hypothetical protein